MYSRKQLIAKLCSVYEQLEAQGAIGDLILSMDTEVYNSKEASKKCRSFIDNVLREKFPRGFRLLTRSTGNRVHIHCAVQLPCSVTGLDWRSFDQAERWYNIYRLTGQRDCLVHYKSFVKAYRASMSEEFLKLHNFVRTKARAYGFGHVKLLPVRKNNQAFKYYLVGNVPKKRAARDKGIHFLSCWNLDPPTKFKVLTREYNGYRRRLKAFCLGLGLTEGNYKESLTAVLGTGWHWQCKDLIKEIDNLGILEIRYEDLKTTLRRHLLRSDQL